jgi:hypothetical protein
MTYPERPYHTARRGAEAAGEAIKGGGTEGEAEAQYF